jgi:ornithine cyclodeaminase
MTNIFTLDQIKPKINYSDLIPLIEKGFSLYSQGKVTVPPVGHLGFKNPEGDVHIKYGYIENDDYYVIKIASGFYENPKVNLPSSNGLMLVFNQKTGQLMGVLLDEGYLTDIRTAAAGAVVAKFLSPKQVTGIGIVGTGIQARLQLELLKEIIDCNKVIVWGRNQDKLDLFKLDMQKHGFDVHTTTAMESLTNVCNFIVTTTPSSEALILTDQVKKGTHITAMGADSKGKQELDSRIIQMADIVVADSISQCIDHGDIAHAIEQKLIDKKDIIELGTMIADTKLQRQNDEQITVADLTGVAVQDIQIAKYVYESLANSS